MFLSIAGKLYSNYNSLNVIFKVYDFFFILFSFIIRNFVNYANPVVTNFQFLQKNEALHVPQNIFLYTKKKNYSSWLWNWALTVVDFARVQNIFETSETTKGS